MRYLLLIILFSWGTAFAQMPNTPSLARTSESSLPQKHKINWRINPFEGKVFIENRGQFDTLLKSTSRVWYGAELGAIKAYFTSDGLTYRYDEYPKKSDEKEESEEAEQEAFKIRKTHYFKILWEGANPDATIEALGKRSDYYVYPTGPASSVEANVFKKIIYRNLYPGIDVEYVFPKDKEGLKYAVIVHPGGDISKVKLKYVGASSLKENREGDVIIKTGFGDFVDHAPISYYEGETNNKVFTKFNLKSQGGSFLLPYSYDTNKTLVIDPWITNPFGGTADGWDIDYDYNGNVYSGSSSRLVKVNSTGTLIWTYIPTTLYCDFTVDRVTGNSFIVGIGGGTAGSVEKVSTTGGLMGTYLSPAPINGSVREFWRAVWNPCTDQIVIGGGGTGGTAGRYQGAIINTNLTGFNYLNVVAAPSSSYDMVGVAVDPGGTTCYMACCFRIPYAGFVKLPLPTLTPTIFNVSDGYQFSEQSHNRYAGSFYNGMNIMTAGNNGVYMWDGYTLSKFNKTTGALITSNAILPPVIVAGGIGTSVKTFWCGIDVDACERLYVGYQTTIKVFNTSLVQTNVINLPSNLDTVHDVAIGYKGKTLYACGEKFLTSIDVAGQATDSIAKATTPASCSCNGTATASLFVQCGNPAAAGVTYSWSNGQTTQTATGLCAGIHNVTLTYNCKPYPDTVTITSPSGLGIAQTQSNVQCYGGNTGGSTANVTGGTAPYTYSWSPAGGTNAAAG
ncbi:MAG: SprB repeat-containing protein, partial [Bacteroidia bacterium]|nr:SprB repeat-containing protein [Bacteroidia bacterium]